MALTPLPALALPSPGELLELATGLDVVGDAELEVELAADETSAEFEVALVVDLKVRRCAVLAYAAIAWCDLLEC